MAIDSIITSALISAGIKGLSSIGQKRNIEEQVEQAKQAARERFDPTDFEPILDIFRERAAEGIPTETESLRRTQALESLFSGQDTDLLRGVGGGRAIAMSQQADEDRMDALGRFETELSRADIEASQRGEENLAQTLFKQRQTESQREAAIEEAEMTGQAELGRRRQASTAAAINTFATLATTPFGEEGQTAIGQLFGGSEEDAGIGLEDLFSAANLGQPEEDAGIGMDELNMAATLGEITQPKTEEDLNLGMSAISSASELGLPQQQDVSKSLVEQQTQQETPVATGTGLEELNRLGDLLSDLGRVASADITSKEEEPFRLGEQTFGAASEFLNRMFGPAVSTPFDIGTFGTRGLLNFPTDFLRELEKVDELRRKRGEPVLN